MTSLYVAGPMTGYDEWNFPAFAKAADELREHGYEVVSPHEIDLEEGFDPLSDGAGFDLRSALERDVAEVLKADGLALLDGWEESSGATVEVLTAASKGAPSRPVREWLRAAKGVVAAVAVVLASAGAGAATIPDGKVQEAGRDLVRNVVDGVEEIVSEGEDPPVGPEQRREQRRERLVV